MKRGIRLLYSDRPVLGASGAGVYAPITASAPGPDPEMASAVVSGAGTAAANGTYERSGEQAGRPKYSMNLSEISWGGSAWAVNDPDGFPFYVSSDDVAYPWLAETWEPSDGSPPAPTVTIG